MMQGTGGMPLPPFPGCLPDTPPEVPDIGSDACLQCLAEQCCGEFLVCGGVATIDVRDENDAGFPPGPRYYCYDFFFGCTRDCFEREVAAGSAVHSDELLVQCGDQCSMDLVSDSIDYRRRDLLACVAGQPRPVFSGEDGDGFVEGEADDDAGTAPNCIAECLPSWR
jgi:hypothetical protein